jgi:hypothetical protein
MRQTIPLIWTCECVSLLCAGRIFQSLGDGPPRGEPPDHDDLRSYLLDMSVSLSRKPMSLHLRADFRPA